MLRVLALALVGLVCGGELAWAVGAEQLCDGAAARAEALTGTPSGVLAAVGAVESGRASRSTGRAAWPWTINAAGQGLFFDTKQEAIAAVYAAMARGVTTIDIGCFQVDVFYHAGVFRSLDDAFDPARNAEEAARILRMGKPRDGSWADAVARYHSARPADGLPYLARVRAAWPDAQRRGLQAQAAAFAEQPSAALPQVVYATPPHSPVARQQHRQFE